MIGEKQPDEILPCKNVKKLKQQVKKQIVFFNLEI